MRRNHCAKRALRRSLSSRLRARFASLAPSGAFDSVALLGTLGILGAVLTFGVSSPAVAQSGPVRVWPDSAWRQIGPASFGGRVDDIEAVASDPRIIFVGTASGGVFRSRNNGVTWDPVFDAPGRPLSIGDIAIAPSDPSVVWVGTGEANNRQSSTWGDGVYRSLDGGTTWQNMGLRETQSIGRVLIDPRDPNVVFVAAVGHLYGPNEERGLYRTRDGGRTWQKVLGVDANTGVTDVAMSLDGRTLLAASYQRRRRAFGFSGGGPNNGIWRSTDGGDTWQRVSAGLPSGVVGRIGVEISRSDPHVAYAVVEQRQGGGVFRSSDGGTTWTRTNPLQDRPYYYGQVRIDPTNVDHVWVLGTLVHQSRDGGKTFVDDSSAKIHPDNHALWIDPRQPDHMLLGNDGGVFATYDGARHWDFIDNLPIGQFYDIAVDDREPYWIYGGLQDNGTFMFPSGTYSRGRLTDVDVTFIGFGDGFQVAIDPTNPRFVYDNSQNGRGYLIDLSTREEKRITPVSSNRSDRYRFNWNTAILVSPHDPHTYYYGSQKLLKTSDYGATWQELSPDVTRHLPWRTLPLGDGFVRDSTTPSRDDGVSEYGNITTIAESPKARGTLLVGTDDGNVQMTTDGGAHWTDITSRFGLAGPRTVSKVVASRHDARVAYVAFDGHSDDDMTPYLFRTSDGGATWTSIAPDTRGARAGQAPAGADRLLGPIKTLTEDPVNPNLLFAGTEFGLYWSPDAGRHWTAAPGVPPVMVDKIVVHERTHDLLLGTHGRSVIILDDISALERGNVLDGARLTSPQLFSLRPATQVYQWRDVPARGDRTFSAPNTPVGALLTYALPAGDTSTPHIQIRTADGSVVRELTGPGGAGLHRVVWDLRGQLPIVPAAGDSGYYGTPRAALVMPGMYTVRLTSSVGSAEQQVEVRVDPRSLATPETLRMRQAIVARIDSVLREVAPAKRRLAAADSELTRINDLAKGRTLAPSADSLLKSVRTQMARLRAQFSESYGAPIGSMFDLLAGLESRAAAPTESERRTLDFAIADLTESIKTLNDVATTKLPQTKAMLIR